MVALTVTYVNGAALIVSVMKVVKLNKRHFFPCKLSSNHPLCAVGLYPQFLDLFIPGLSDCNVEFRFTNFQFYIMCMIQ